MSAGPDPGSASTPEEFVELLRDIRADSGLSFWEIQKHAHEHGYDLEPAAMVHALGKPVLPEWQIVAGLLVACGYQRMQIDRWLHVYRHLAEQAALPQREEAAAAVPRAARRWTYGRVLYVTAAGAIAVFVLLIAATWDSDPGPAAALSSSPADSPTTASSAADAAAQRPAPAATAQPPSSAAPPTNVSVVGTGTVTLTAGQGVDLDTGRSSGDLDIIATSGTGLKTGDVHKRLQRMAGMPTAATCQGLKLGQLERDAADLAVGQWLCVRTSAGRWARVNVVATGPALNLAYTVWT